MSTYERLRQIKPTGISRNLLDDTDDWVGLLHVSQLGDVTRIMHPDDLSLKIRETIKSFAEEWNLKLVDLHKHESLFLHRINKEWFALITEL